MANALLVPIHLDALVRTQPMTVPRAAATIEDWSEVEQELDTGIHLHWTLPDGLTRIMMPTHPLQPDRPDPDHPYCFAVPDQWVIVRFGPVAGAAHRTLKIWVRDVRTSSPATLLCPPDHAKWQVPPGPERPVVMTAFGVLAARRDAPWTAELPRSSNGANSLDGQPGHTDPLGLTGSAFYPRSWNHFGFHDPATDLNPGDQVSYLVVGMYADPGNDPCTAPSRAKKAPQRLTEIENFARDAFWSWEHSKETEAPDQMVCHGAVFGVAWIGLGKASPAPGAYYTSAMFGETWRGAGKDAPAPRIKFAPEYLVAPTLQRALAEAFVDEKDDDEDAADYLEAVLHRLEGTLKTPLGRLQAGHTLHRAGFESRPGETVQVWEVEYHACSESLEEAQWVSADPCTAGKDMPRSSKPKRYVKPGVWVVQPEGPAFAAWRLLAGSQWYAQRFEPPTNTLVIVRDQSEQSEAYVELRADLEQQIEELDAAGRSDPDLVEKRDNLTAESRRIRMFMTDLARSARVVQTDAHSYAAIAQDLPILRLMGWESGVPMKGIWTIAVKDVASPRWFKPRAPTLMIWGIGRATRHGFDGILDPNEGRLQVRSLSRVVRGVRASYPTIFKKTMQRSRNRCFVYRTSYFRRTLVGGSGTCPPGYLKTCPPVLRCLMEESIFIDPTNYGHDVVSQSLRFAYGRMGELLRQNAMAQLSTGETFDNAGGAEPDVLAPFGGWLRALGSVTLELAADADAPFQGQLPSLVAARRWTQPWLPLFVDVSYTLRPGSEQTTLMPVNASGASGWDLEEVDFEPVLSSNGQFEVGPKGFRAHQRLQLTATGIGMLDDAYQRIYGQPTVEPGSSRLSRSEFESSAVLTATLSRVNETWWKAGRRIGGGTLEIDAIRVVDAFGQSLELGGGFKKECLSLPKLSSIHYLSREDEDELTACCIGGNPSVAKFDPLLLLRPRLPFWARLSFRLRDAWNQELDANSVHSPICGYLLPDYIEQALEVFDAHGVRRGQLVITNKGTTQERVDWETEPSHRDDASSLNPQLKRVISTFDLAESVGAFKALLKVADTSRLTIAPSNISSSFSALISGRAIAVVRARAELQTAESDTWLRPEGVNNGLPSPEKRPTDLKVPILIGSVESPDDGVFGFFLDSERDRSSTPTSAVSSAGRYSSFHLVDHAVRDVVLENLEKEIDPEFISMDCHVLLAPYTPVDMTLLVDPFAAIHATSGVLPRKRIDLPMKLMESALKEMATAFAVGPVLGRPADDSDDSNALRLYVPLPAVKGRTWRWLGEGPGERPERPVTSVLGTAEVRDQAIEVHSGRLQLVWAEDNKPELEVHPFPPVWAAPEREP